MAAGATVTVPFCGSCGFDANHSLNDDTFCDACGADLLRFGFTGLIPPADFVLVAAPLGATATWTAAPDTQDLLVQIAGGTPVIAAGETSPASIGPAQDAGDKISVAIRTVLNGVAGPWSPIQSVEATA